MPNLSTQINLIPWQPILITLYGLSVQLRVPAVHVLPQDVLSLSNY